VVKWLDAIIELLRQFAPSLAEWWSQRLQDRRERKDMERELQAKESARRAQREQDASQSLGNDAGDWLRATRRMRHKQPRR